VTLRVGFDLGIQGGEHPTGVERAQATLLAGLDSARASLRGDHEFVMLSPREVPAALRETLPADAEFPNAPGLARGLSLPLALWRETTLPRQVSEHAVDVIVSPVAAIPLRARCAKIATLHELPWAEEDGVTRRVADTSLPHRARTALAARSADRIVCVSERTRTQFLRRHPQAEERTVVVPHGVHPRFVRTDEEVAAPRSVAEGAQPTVLAIGRLRRKKNLVTLLDAFARSRAAATHRLLIVGPEGDAGPALTERIAEPDLQGRVERLGFVDDERLVQLYREASCLCHTSLLEGFGLPVLEAMSAGVPVVASRQGAADEVRGRAVQECDALDADSIASALDAVLGDPARARELVALGRAHAAGFTAAACAQRVLELCAASAGSTASR
jgi:glycosyltransferase involved in cell wall biosynthesis